MAKKAVLTNYELKTDKLDKKLKIALIADLHERRWDDLLPLIKQAQPDIIAIAGDTFERYSDEVQEVYLDEDKKKFKPVRWLIFNIAYYINFLAMIIFQRRNRPDTERTYEFMREISKIAPVYMSVGNHEQKFLDEDLKLFKELNIKLLDNSAESFNFGGEEIFIGGLSTFYDEKFLDRFSENNGYKILLCHHPIYYERFVRDKDIDLVLAGHNHGGQVRFRNRGLLSSGEGFFPKYDKGVFEGRLVVSAGCSGTVAIPRINNPREIIIIEAGKK